MNIPCSANTAQCRSLCWPTWPSSGRIRCNMLNTLAPGADPCRKVNFLIESPNVQSVAEYLAAFYYPLPVTILPLYTLTLTSWTLNGKASRSVQKSISKAPSPKFMALDTSTENIRIFVRPAHPSSTPISSTLTISSSRCPWRAETISTQKTCFLTPWLREKNVV